MAAYSEPDSRRRIPVLPIGSDAYAAPNRAQDWQVTFSPAGTQVYPANGSFGAVQYQDWSWGLMSKGNAIQIVVDDAAATYPLTIDPWLESAILHASDAQASDFFGRTVAVSGDTAVIGAPYEDGGTGNLASDSGVAYVFGSCIRSTQSGSWSSTTTWAGGVAPVGADGVCVLNGHTVTLGATIVQVMGNTAVCNNNDSGNYRNRCFMENSANSGSATLTLHSTSGEDDIADDTFFQIRFCPGASCNDAVGGGGTCAGTATFASPAYFLIGSQGSSPTAVTL